MNSFSRSRDKRKSTKGSIRASIISGTPRRRATHSRFGRKNTKTYRDSIYSVQTIKSNKSTKSEKRALTSEKVEFALQNKKCTRPRGLLSIHVKKLHLEGLEMYKIFKKYNATMYIRMSCQGQMKCTTAYHNITCPSSTLLDEIKHFRLRLSSRKMDPTNFLRFELIACPQTHGDHTHKVLSLKDIHLYDVIKTLFSVDPIIWRTDDKLIGELDVEICFAYGSFGYGYSSQFVNKNKTIEENIAYSMYCYTEPPEGREDYSLDIMTCRHIGHPNFINFKHKVDIGMAAFADDLSAYTEMKKTQAKRPRFLLSKIRKPLQEMQKEYGSQPTRIARLDYLRQKVSQPGPYTELENGNFEVTPGQYKLRFSNLIAPVPESDHRLGSSHSDMPHILPAGLVQHSTEEDTQVHSTSRFYGLVGMVTNLLGIGKRFMNKSTDEETATPPNVSSQGSKGSKKSKSSGETPFLTPKETPGQTPGQTPYETPKESLSPEKSSWSIFSRSSWNSRNSRKSNNKTEPQ